MQRIKLNVFKSWFDKNLTGKEIDFLLVLSFYQDKRGVTRVPDRIKDLSDNQSFSLLFKQFFNQFYGHMITLRTSIAAD